MKSRYKIAALGGLAAVSGAVACWKWMIRMPLKEFTRYALYMAAMDDETCRNELEGNQIGDEVIKFPPKEKTSLSANEPSQKPQTTPGGNCGHGAAASGVPTVHWST